MDTDAHRSESELTETVIGSAYEIAEAAAQNCFPPLGRAVGPIG